jgi:hypothetical protein
VPHVALLVHVDSDERARTRPHVVHVALPAPRLLHSKLLLCACPASVRVSPPMRQLRRRRTAVAPLECPQW